MDDKQVFRSLKKRTYSKNNKQNWGGEETTEKEDGGRHFQVVILEQG